MHHRGYRHAKGEAPLREDLAAFVVMLSRHDSRSEILVDPMAGSATIGIEAACLGQGRGVWASGRIPACLSWPAFVDSVPKRAKPIFGDTEPAVFVNEVDLELCEVARRNAETAGVASALHVRHGDFREITRKQLDAFARSRGLSEGRGVIVCNPPYGQRIGRTQDVEALYSDLGRWARSLRGYRAAMLVANPGFEAAFGLRPRVKKPVRNGPLDAIFYLYDL
jgi:putative N6-adenine-specific DNA methylase